MLRSVARGVGRGVVRSVVRGVAWGLLGMLLGVLFIYAVGMGFGLCWNKWKKGKWELSYNFSRGFRRAEFS